MNDETITLELPVWMVRQLRGLVRHERSKTRLGAKDNKEIEYLLP